MPSCQPIGALALAALGVLALGCQRIDEDLPDSEHPPGRESLDVTFAETLAPETLARARLGGDFQIQFARGRESGDSWGEALPNVVWA